MKSFAPSQQQFDSGGIFNLEVYDIKVVLTNNCSTISIDFR